MVTLTVLDYYVFIVWAVCVPISYIMCMAAAIDALISEDEENNTEVVRAMSILVLVLMGILVLGLSIMIFRPNYSPMKPAIQLVCAFVFIFVSVLAAHSVGTPRNVAIASVSLQAFLYLVYKFIMYRDNKSTLPLYE